MSVRIGIDLGGTKISGVVLDAAGAEVLRRRVPSPRHDYAATLDAVTELAGRLEAEAGVAPGTATVGIGTPGTWQQRLKCMKNCNSTWLNDRPLAHDLRERLGERVRIANDADCLAVSEAADGAAAGAASLFAVILGTGVGGGVVVGGRLQQGPNGLAGEWGHTPLPYLRQRIRPADGPAEATRFQLESGLEDRHCYCGRLNCIEGYLSGPGLATTHAALSGEQVDAATVAGRETPARRASWDLYVHMLARSLAQIVNVLDPEVLVVGGGLSNAAGLCDDLAGRIPAFAFTSLRAAGVDHQAAVEGWRRGEAAQPVPDDVRVTVRRAQWGDDSGVRGAARLWDGR